jgi:hypothetical protein
MCLRTPYISYGVICLFIFYVVLIFLCIKKSNNEKMYAFIDKVMPLRSFIFSYWLSHNICSHCLNTICFDTFDIHEGRIWNVWILKWNIGKVIVFSMVWKQNINKRSNFSLEYQNILTVLFKAIIIKWFSLEYQGKETSPNGWELRVSRCIFSM